MAIKAKEKGFFRAVEATDPDVIRSAQAFRAKCFQLSHQIDHDEADACCRQVLIEDVRSGELVCCFRMRDLTGSEIYNSYSASYYDLSSLAGLGERSLEVGRFCVDPERCDPDILRLAWSVLTDYVDANFVSMLFGCASFQGVKAIDHADAFALLRARYLAPAVWAPSVKAMDRHIFPVSKPPKFDAARALQQIPPLLRSYLAMGARVSDHAVIDRHLQTMHVFTGLEVETIPDKRKQRLRAL